MPASRRTRKHIKLGTQGTAQSTKVTEQTQRPRPHREDEYVSPEQREQFRRERPRLVQQYAALPLTSRQTREDEFRDRLRAICISDAAAFGYWDTFFAPLLDSDTAPAPPASPSPSRPTSRPAGPSTAHVSRAVMTLAARFPGQLRVEDCVAVLAGKPARELTREVKRHRHCGEFAHLNPETLAEAVEAAVKRGHVVRGGKRGALMPAR